jgi:acyl-CoA synthetase (AMP-forming)/AMP-acid ligase II
MIYFIGKSDLDIFPLFGNLLALVKGITNKTMTKNTTNIADVLLHRSQQHPEKIAYTFLVDDNKPYCEYSYRALDCATQAIARRLLGNTEPGDRVVLLYTSEHLFVPAFLACAYAGVIAVPTLPPTNNNLVKKLQAVLSDCTPTMILSESKVIKKVERLLARSKTTPSPFLQSLFAGFSDETSVYKGMNTELLPPLDTPSATMERAHSNEVAFLQYTSGSTGTPKGVMVRHSSLMENMELMKQAYKMDEQNVTVTWLPVTHDMGLIGTILMLLYVGGHGVVMSPLNFLFRPHRWLQAISDYKAYSSTAPNFAYRFCCERITQEQRATLDLSHWKVATCGAEPIRPATMRRFAEVFAPCGFSPEKLHCSYGLAEATLFVSSSNGLQINAFDAARFKQNKVVAYSGVGVAQELVSCGQPHVLTKIVNPDTLLECPEAEVGEVWISGPSVCQGYWNKPEINEVECRAVIKGEPDTHYVRTGDLGFMFDGELYIAGRSKETIIIDGVNYYPQDIEEVILQANDTLQGCNAVAFSHEQNEQEVLVVVAELQRHTDSQHYESIAQDIQAAILRSQQLTVAAIVLLPRGRLPKTTSGKLQRRLCQQEYIQDQLKTRYQDAFIFETMPALA